MSFVRKEEITTASVEYHDAKRNEALKTMRDEIAQTLTEALKIAGETGDEESYRDKSLTIPDYFKDAKGTFNVPEEIEEEVEAAGYKIHRSHSNQYKLW